MMTNNLFDTLFSNAECKAHLQERCIETEVAVKTVLLREGDIAKSIYVVKKGCLREWFNKDGKDITFQFFFEGQPVASIDSFMNQKPSLFTIESVEPSTVIEIKKADFEFVLSASPEFEAGFHDFIFQRFSNYGQLFMSRIKDTPRERYEDLVIHHPEIIQRVPQHYIASFLGITPISLSRIRNRKKS
ncbi:CRP-like cAMP-binding protein [Breznakibacter xylanolyticus]|uniref:CRP-like cAMP-binding protein n=2 Tax=Breznakibacter xylanolyticus TaxID=990 RepID=A0A2W7MZZ3_9BACT|nr:CRP-like cAMP-binding protein [Breznakibacter xylanolyticus]